MSAPAAPAARDATSPVGDAPGEAEQAEQAPRRTGGLLGAAAGVAGLMLLGNALGFVRDMVLAAVFGAGVASDAFVVGWTVPETFSTLLLEGLLPLVLVPWLVAKATTRQGLRDAVGALVVPVLGLGLLAGGIVALAADLVVRLVAPDIADPGLARQCVQLAAFTVPALTLAGTLSAVLRSAEHLVLPSAVYSVYNIGILGTTIALEGTLGVRAAALGLSVGAGLMCLVQLPQVVRLVGVPRLRRASASAAGSALLIAVPTLGYLLTRQAQVFVERFYGSQLDGGAITSLNYAQKLGQFPVTIALSLALVTFPSLSRYAAEGDTAAVRALLAKVTRAIAVLLVPATAGVIAASRPVVGVAFGRGAFGADAISATAATLAVYGVGLFAQALVSTAALAHFAVVRRTWVPAAWAAACLLVTVVVDATTVGPWGTRGIALGNALGITAAAIGLYGSLVRKGFFRPADVLGPLGRAVAVAAVGGALAWAAAHLLPGAPLQLAGALLGFGVAYGVVLVASRGALLRDIAGAREAEPEPLDQVESQTATAAGPVVEPSAEPAARPAAGPAAGPAPAPDRGAAVDGDAEPERVPRNRAEARALQGRGRRVGDYRGRHRGRHRQS